MTGRWRKHALPLLAVAVVVAAAVAATRWFAPPRRFGVVRAGGLYRSGQPRARDWKLLRRYGVQTVVNLRMGPEDPACLAEERRACAAEGVRLVHIPMHTRVPSDEQLRQFLHAVRSGGPALVHCRHGEKRTGVMAAAYRIIVQDWPIQRVRAEMARYSVSPRDSKHPEFLAWLMRLKRDRQEWLRRAAHPQ